MDGILYLVCFLAGSILSLSISSYYNNRIIELMREMMNSKRKREKTDNGGEVSDGK